jgi:hypothetical protein
MAATVIDPEQWYADYEAASARQQHQMLLDILTQPLSPELIEELDLGMLLVMMRDVLVNHNQLDQASELIHTLKTQQPALHQEEFAFLDNFLVEYYLYHNQLEQVRSALQLFMSSPAEDVDQTLSILDYLKFYDAADLAIELSRAAYAPVQASPNVVLGTETEFGRVVLHGQIQQAYQQLQQGQNVDWEAFLAEAVQYGEDKKQKWVTELQQHLTTEVAETPEFLARFKRDREEALRALSIAFSQYMLEQKQMSFVCSQAIWQAISEFLENREIPRKKLTQPDVYFSFTQDELDKYLTQKIGGLLSLEQSIGIATLWGIPYAYDLLQEKQLISDQTYEQAIDNTNALKTILIDDYPQLWKFDFVHRWTVPDCISQETFAAESKRFAATLEPMTPLSDEPGEGVTHQTFIDELKQQIPPDLLAAFEELQLDENGAFLEDEDEDEDEAPIRSSWSNPPLMKPEKPRKSALQLAAELPESNKKGAGKSTGKRKKKR